DRAVRCAEDGKRTGGTRRRRPRPSGRGGTGAAAVGKPLPDSRGGTSRLPPPRRAMPAATHPPRSPFETPMEGRAGAPVSRRAVRARVRGASLVGPVGAPAASLGAALLAGGQHRTGVRLFRALHG